jgi:hypothetical protein
MVTEEIKNHYTLFDVARFFAEQNICPVNAFDLSWVTSFTARFLHSFYKDIEAKLGTQN